MAVDFAVIGAGIAGASAAYELAQYGSVKLFEMEATAGYHSTGRSAALFTECDGPASIRHLAVASREFLLNPPDNFSDTPVLHERGVLFVAVHGQEQKIDAFYKDQVAMVPAVSKLSPEETTVMCPVLVRDAIAGGVFEPEAMDIDVHALHQGYLAGLKQRGGTLATSTPVTALARSGSAWRVKTVDEVEEAGVVVNAAGAWCDVVGAMAGLEPIGLQPKRRTAFTFAAPQGVDHRGWPMVVEAEHDFYFRPEGPSLLGSPGDQTPVEPQDIKHEEIDVALAIDRIQSVTTMQIRTVQSAWAGLRSFVPDGLPVVGFDPAVDGFFWLAGQGGYGILSSPAMSRLTAGLIAEGAAPASVTSFGLDPARIAPERLDFRY